MTNKHAPTAKSQKGSVLIIVLWTSVLLTVLVTAMAGKVRLSAQTVAHNQDVSTHWAAVMGSVHQAEMELMLEMMAPPIDQEVELTEVGPRFEMQLYQIKLGTVDVTAADNEWVWRPYQNTAKSRQVL